MRLGAGSRVAFSGLVLAFSFLCAPPGLGAPVAVRAAPVLLYPDNPGKRRAGSLLYRGGLVLSSGASGFGGWSDLAVSRDGGAILAISDGGHWLKARLSYHGNGDLAGLIDAEMAPMLDTEGRALSGRNADPEGLTLERPNDLDGAAIVSFERNPRVWRYDLSRGLDARPVNVPIGAWTESLRGNRQLEAVTLLRPDTLLVFAESRARPGEDILAAMEAYPGGNAPLTRMLSVRPRDPFSITGAAPAPDGGVYLLERRFSLAGGVGMQIRHVAPAEIFAGARLQGSVLANLSFQEANIDNMEGLAVRQGPRGETLLYLLSDDNYLPFQRTLLLLFEVR